MTFHITESVIQKVYQVISQFLKRKHAESNFTNYSISAFSIRSGCGTAENYLSSIYAVTFETETTTGDKQSQNYDLILKSEIISSKDEQEKIETKYFWNAIFQKEYLVYADILSNIEEIGRFSLSPKLHHFFTEGEIYCCLVFDNLKSLGYYIPEVGFTFVECSALVKTLAQLHALSLFLEAKDRIPLPEKYPACQAELVYSKDLASVVGAIMLKNFFGVLKAVEVQDPIIATKLRKLNEEQNIWERLCHIVKPGLTSFDCICHGDPRPANIFFRSKSSTNVGVDSSTFDSDPEVKLIDFQLTRYASPITDLQYAICLGTTKAFRDQHLNTMLKIYFDQFKSVLAKYAEKFVLNPKATSWTFECFKDEYKVNNLYGLLISVTLLPMLLTEKKKKEQQISWVDMSPAERDEFFDKNWQQFITGCMLSDSGLSERILDICNENMQSF